MTNYLYLPVDTVFTGHVVFTSPLVGSVVCPVSVCIHIGEFAVTVIVNQNIYICIPSSVDTVVIVFTFGTSRQAI